MILVNGREFQWEEGLTVAELLKKKNYTYPKIVVRVNGKVISNEEFASTVINDGDDVKAIHLLAGG
ncbi:MAG: sulfur carrier protein ThiS [Caulobacteraceae bacterium]